MAGSHGLDRRAFARGSLAAGLGALFLPRLAHAATGGSVALVLDPPDPIVASAPVQWAVAELQSTLDGLNVSLSGMDRMGTASQETPVIYVAGPSDRTAQDILQRARVPIPSGPDAFALVPAAIENRPAVVAVGSDPRGLVYAITELADRALHAPDPIAALRPDVPLAQRPASPVRSIARCFESVAEDPSWFHDRAMWREYLSMLVANRVGRFSMTFGLQYNYPMEVSDVYLYFAYPFLFGLPGYPVRAAGLPDAERDRNLATLQFIAQETARRGLDFQIGLWTHGYKYDSPRANYRIEGITPQNHANYCRDALALLLKSVPEISGVTFRIHGESGIPEGSYDFWQVVFDAIAKCGRPVGIDMHGKGMDQRTIDLALATGQNVTVSPKYMGEHIGLPYHESAIRSVDMPPKGAVDPHFTFSEGSRKFTRYSYADFLAQDRKHDVIFRIWPGTQRALLWGDPMLFAGYGRFASFCGADGLELCEPLSFKGRMGSGRPGSRTGYADAALLQRFDWQKYALTYRLWGRLTYDPDAPPESWQRAFASTFGADGPAAATALAQASRILPIITLAHGASASNNSYWPECYTNMSIVQDDPVRPYYDTPLPRRFGWVESFDGRMFTRIVDCAESLLADTPDARYAPFEVAQWLDALAAGTQGTARQMRSVGPEQARLLTDVELQAMLGRFFAAKIRAALLWEIFRRTQESAAAAAALGQYRQARAAWADAVQAAEAYVPDLSYGPEPWLRGNWRDRLPAIDADIAEMERLAGDTGGQVRGNRDRIFAAIGRVLAPEPRPIVQVRHDMPSSFKRGQPLPLMLVPAEEGVSAARLHYRHVNQAEAWQEADMAARNGSFSASIPADYTQTQFPLQYYFELRSDSHAALFPGLQAGLATQPYFVVLGA